MRVVLALVSFLQILLVYGQEGDTVIEIKKTKWKISLKSNDSILWIGKQNKIQLEIAGGNNFTVEFADGTIRKSANGNNYFIQVNEVGAATLTVYELLPKNKKKVLYSKLFEVKNEPAPLAYVCGVKADSVIDKQQIIRGNSITLVDTFHHVQLPVVGFILVFEYDTQTDTLFSNSSKLTLDMKRRIYYLASGTILNIEAVYYKTPSGKIEQTAPFSIFINETNKYKVGYAQILKE